MSDVIKPDYNMNINSVSRLGLNPLMSNNKLLVNNYEKLAQEYGLFSKQVMVYGPTNKGVPYLVFSLNPISDNINPVEIVNRSQRNPNLFYVNDFAVCLAGDNPLITLSNVLEYLSYAEFMYELYEQFNTELPEVIRIDELEELINFCDGQHNMDFDEELRAHYAQGVKDFFEKENSKGKFSKAWQKFYRSEFFDENKTFTQNFLVYLKRGEPEINIEALLESGNEIRKVYVPEHRYKEFREKIKSDFPDVKYHVSDKKVKDKGLIVDPETGSRVSNQYGICVTDEEFDRIFEKSFSSEGFGCIEDLNPSYFEGRNVYYKASDENIIAFVLNGICFRWAKCSSLEELETNGALEMVDIPSKQMKNFYVSMRRYNIPFHIDNNINRNPNFKVCHVLYNSCDREKVTNIVAGLAIANMSLSHVDIPEDTKYFVDADKVGSLIKKAQKKSKSMVTKKPMTSNYDIAHEK